MVKFSTVDWVAFILVIIGALNWGIIGLFNVNIVGAIFGLAPILLRIIYIVVGIAGAYLIYYAYTKS